jgi:hypothetical protein
VVFRVRGYSCTRLLGDPNRLRNPLPFEQFENVVPYEHPPLEAPHANLPVNVLRHVRDDALLARAELLRGGLRAFLASLLAWLLEAEAHAFRLSERAIGA